MTKQVFNVGNVVEGQGVRFFSHHHGTTSMVHHFYQTGQILICFLHQVIPTLLLYPNLCAWTHQDCFSKSSAMEAPVIPPNMEQQHLPCLTRQGRFGILNPLEAPVIPPLWNNINIQNECAQAVTPPPVPPQLPKSTHH
jgi:hypothetical protein